ncbi:MAG: radical SAM protein [Candidatus Yonathbacteria bacterium]|nr:radical SAM protein [Candidatus Yonathbacteria bacterium]
MSAITHIDSIRVDLTNRCNARCGFCPYHGTNGTVTKLLRMQNESHTQLELEDFKSIVGELVRANQFPRFKFSGRGEATIHPYFEKIVELIAKNGMTVRLITNGINLGRFIKLLHENKVSTLISIHGPEEIHDKTVGVRGAYQKATAAICTLKKMGADVSIATVITPELLARAPSFTNEWTTRGVEVRIQHDHSAWRLRTFLAEEIQEFVSETAATEQVTFLPNLNNALIDTYYACNTSLVLAPHECERVLNEVDLCSDGALYACRSAPFGNIRDNGIMSLISGVSRKMFLEKILNETKSADGLNAVLCDRCCYQSSILTKA